MHNLIFTNPGSEKAVANGCLCPQMDNAYGRGYMGGATDEHGNTAPYTQREPNSWSVQMPT